jgi:hypothetical protein
MLRGHLIRLSRRSLFTSTALDLKSLITWLPHLHFEERLNRGAVSTRAHEKASLKRSPNVSVFSEWIIH